MCDERLLQKLVPETTEACLPVWQEFNVTRPGIEEHFVEQYERDHEHFRGEWLRFGFAKKT